MNVFEDWSYDNLLKRKADAQNTVNTVNEELGRRRLETDNMEHKMEVNEMRDEQLQKCLSSHQASIDEIESEISLRKIRQGAMLYIDRIVVPANMANDSGFLGRRQLKSSDLEYEQEVTECLIQRAKSRLCVIKHHRQQI